MRSLYTLPLPFALVFLQPALVRAAFGAPELPASKPFDLIGWNGGQFIYGVDLRG